MTLLDLDIRTTMRLMVIGNLIAIAMLAAYRIHEQGARPMRTFLLSKAFQAIGWLLLSLRNEIPLQLSGHVANLMLLIGFSLEMVAFSRLSNRRWHFETALAVFVAFGSLPLCFTTDLSLWVVIVSFAVVGIYTLSAVMLLRQPDASRLQTVIAGFFIAFCVVMVIRIYSALVHGIGLFSITPIHSLTYISLFGFMVVGSIGFLLLVKEKLDTELQFAATTDYLTGILSRREFFAKSEFSLNIAIRNGMPMTMLTMDIDHFKRINDAYGHAAGDAVLQAFTNNVRKQIRPHDVFGRLGGEEFAVLIINSSNGAVDIGERIRASTEKQVVEYGDGLRYTVSIGISTCIPRYISDLTILLQRSDAALYQAKNNGRNQVCME